MPLLILLGSWVGLVLGVIGRRNLMARRVGASLVALDVCQRIYFFVVSVAQGHLQTSYRGQVLAGLFWAAIEVLVILWLWRGPRQPAQ